MNTEILDVRNMLCPMPVIRTQATVARLKHGDRLVALCTDPGALNDIPAWVRIHGHRLIRAERRGDEIEIELEVCKP
jgi:tRNA 2-thiouridine synthesizing protein A